MTGKRRLTMATLPVAESPASAVPAAGTEFLPAAVIDAKLQKSEMLLRAEMHSKLDNLHDKIGGVKDDVADVKISVAKIETTSRSMESTVNRFIDEQRDVNRRNAEAEQRRWEAEQRRLETEQQAALERQAQNERIGEAEKQIRMYGEAAIRSARRAHRGTEEIAGLIRHLSSPSRIMAMISVVGIVWSGMGKTVAHLIPWVRAHPDSDRWMELTGIFVLIVLVTYIAHAVPPRSPAQLARQDALKTKVLAVDAEHVHVSPDVVEMQETLEDVEFEQLQDKFRESNKE